MRASLARGWRAPIWSTLILGVVTAATLGGALRPLDDLLAGVRFGLVQREASQTLAVVEIDSRSLKAADAWPWDRRRYAVATDRLIAAGATLVAYDVDFSAPSEPAADAALAAAVSRHPGQVVLASFDQMDSYGAGDRKVTGNRPIPPLLKDSLLASVNVPVDADGRVRHYDRIAPGSGLPSLGAVMAGAANGGGFTLDFSIRPHSVPQLSFEDVYQGRFDPAAVRGRTVLIGATALELGDEFSTPVGLLPGVFIHAVGYESLTSGRALLSLSPAILLLLCAALALLLQPARDGGPGVRRLLLKHLLCFAGWLALPLLVQQFAPISLEFAPLLMTQVLLGVWATRVELSRQARAIIAEREAGLVHLATHQPETGLPNRRALLAGIEARQAEEPSDLTVFTVGVERHAEMRGLLGYEVANRLMVALASRISEVADTDLVAQVATSVLGFVRTNLADDDRGRLLDRLRELERTFCLEGQSIDLFLRIGCASRDTEAASAEILVERATTALNEAARSDDRVAAYDATAASRPENNLALMSEMREAMAAAHLTLHYQPKKSTADGRVTSVEALCRWEHPARGPVSPALFIPIAEQTGQIRALTEWSLDQVIADQARLRDMGHDLTIALNISGVLLADEAFRDHALEKVARSRARLAFEITETAVIQHPSIATETLAACRAAGIKISIDDYGSGLSSLGYLKMMKADELKIDRSVLMDVLDSRRDQLIVRSTVDLAHGLGMTVVAEGVETQAMFDRLAELGCDLIQGYWVARALPLPALAAFLDGAIADADPVGSLEPA